MLIGHYYSKYTKQNRTSLPVKFRKILGKKIILAKWYEGCLVLVNEAKIEALLNKVTAKSDFITRDVRDTDRFILGSAFEIDADVQGRFVVPKILSDYAGLNEEVVFVGLGDRVEVWDKKNWIKKEKSVLDNAEEQLENVAKGYLKK